MISKIKFQYYKSPVGELILASFDDKLCLADWRYRKMRSTIDYRLQKSLKADFIEQPSTIIHKTIQQLKEYFDKKRQLFDLDLLLIGTDFQKSVWKELINTNSISRCAK